MDNDVSHRPRYCAGPKGGWAFTGSLYVEAAMFWWQISDFELETSESRELGIEENVMLPGPVKVDS